MIVNQVGKTIEGGVEIIKEKELMVHDFETEAGMSGAPIIHIDSDNKLTIVAIHKGKVISKQKKV